MKIIHIAGKAKKLFYQSTEDIYRELLCTITNREGVPEVLQIYTYPEEAFKKQETIFFTEQETEGLCTELQQLLVKNNVNVVLCFGILREEIINEKRFLINSAVMISKERAMVFDKQIVSDCDTIWEKVTEDNTLNFTGDYVDIFSMSQEPYTYSHSYFDTTVGYTKMRVADSSSYVPPEMAVSGMMQRSTGTRVGQVWRNYMTVETVRGTVGIWIGICKEICIGNFLHRYENFRAGAGFDKEIMIILANNLDIRRNRDKIPRLPFLYNDRCKDNGLTGCMDEYGNLQIYKDGIFSID